ncbi:MFS transporter [Pseudonocardia alni]
MVVLDSTVVTIALPSAQVDLTMSDVARGWMITAYSLAFGAVLLLGGRLADRWGPRGAFVVGLTGFGVASLLAGLAPTTVTLLVGRGLQGVFAALLAPAGLAIISRSYIEPRERGTAFGVYGALTGAGAVVGLLLGGALTEFFGWRWTLLINVPIVLLALLGAARTVPLLTGTPMRLDLRGAALSALGMAALVVGLAQAGTSGLAAPSVLVPVVLGGLLLAAFLLLQARIGEPLLPPAVVRDRARAGALLAVGLPQLALFGFFLVLTYWFQQLLGYTPVRAGLAFLPLAVAIAVGSTAIAGVLATRLPARWLMTCGLIVMSGGMLVLVGLDPVAESLYWTRFLPAELLIGIGLGITITSAVATATSRVADAHTGAASAAVNVVTQLGGALGVALLNSIAAATTTAALAATQGGSEPARETAAIVAGFDASLLTGAAILAASALVVAAVVPTRTTTAPDVAEQP